MSGVMLRLLFLTVDEDHSDVSSNNTDFRISLLDTRSPNQQEILLSSKFVAATLAREPFRNKQP